MPCPTYFCAWWEPKSSKPNYLSPIVWKEANPGFGDIISEADFASVVLRTPEAEFKTKRLNMFVNSQNTWLPHLAWDNCAKPKKVIADKAKVVLGFDGSRTGDNTALVVVSIEEAPHIEVIGLWEKPLDAAPGWQVPRHEVLNAIRDACLKWEVIEIASDIYLWQTEMADLEAEGFPVVQMEQNAVRMVPLTQEFYERVMTKALSHSGDPRLARHIENAVLRTSNKGSGCAGRS